MSEIRSQAAPAKDQEQELKRDLLAGDLLGNVIASDAARMARTAIQRGWSKPRTVNSIEEALTLPQGTVIRPGPIVWPRSGEISVGISDQRHYVHWTGSNCPDELATWMLPFTVLFTPRDAG